MVQRLNRNRSRGGETGGAFSQPAEQEQLLLEQQILGNQGFHATRLEEFLGEEHEGGGNHE